jgi:hypothetical protein
MDYREGEGVIAEGTILSRHNSASGTAFGTGQLTILSLMLKKPECNGLFSGGLSQRWPLRFKYLITKPRQTVGHLTHSAFVAIAPTHYR